MYTGLYNNTPRPGKTIAMTTDKHIADDWCIRISALLLFLALLAVFLQRMPVSMHNAGRWDIDLFLGFAHQFLLNGELYARDPSLYAPLKPVYKYPPLSGAVLVQMLRFGFSDAAVVFIGAITQLAAGFIAILVLVRALLPAQRAAGWLLAFALFMALSPLLEENIIRLQLETGLLFLLSLSLVCLLRKQDFAAGMLIGIAAMLKIYPGIMLLYFLLTRRHYATAGFAAGCFSAAMFSLLVLGWQEHVFFLRDVLPALLREAPDLSDENVSFCCFPQLLGLPPAGPGVCHLASLGLLLTAAAVIRTEALPSARATATGFALFTILLVTAIPNSLWNYQILHVLPITTLACLAWHDRFEQRASANHLMTAVLVLAIVVFHITASITVDEKFYADPTFIKVWLFAVARVYTPLLLFVMVAICHRKTNAPYITSFS